MHASDQLLVAGSILTVGVVTFCVCLPLIYRKVPMNHLYGIRIPLAFVSNERWYAINEYGGRLLARWSCLSILTGTVGFILPPHTSAAYTCFAIAVVLISVLVPLIQTIRWARFTGQT